MRGRKERAYRLYAAPWRQHALDFDRSVLTAVQLLQQQRTGLTTGTGPLSPRARV